MKHLYYFAPLALLIIATVFLIAKSGKRGEEVPQEDLNQEEIDAIRRGNDAPDH